MAAPSVSRNQPSSSSATEHVRLLLARYGWNTMACQILSPGMQHWFTPDCDGVVGYVPARRLLVAAGAPVCPPEQLATTAVRFMAAAAWQGRQVCYFGAQDRFVAALADQHLPARLLIGTQPVWDPAGWPMIVKRKASLRAQLGRARNKGVLITPLAADLASQSPALRRCLKEWLETRGLPALQFVVTPDTLTVPHDRLVLVATRNTAVVGYLVATPIPQRNGWLIEQIVRGRLAPNGTAELLIDTAMQMFTERGSSYVTMGLVPLAAHPTAQTSHSSVLARTLLAWLRAHGRRFYNFGGLETFKAKLQPDYWEPIYLLSAERKTSLRTLYAITEAFGGAPPLLFLSHALVRAAAQELRWIGERFTCR